MSDERIISHDLSRNPQLATNLRRGVNVARTLRRIRQIILDTVRSYECSKKIVHGPLHTAKANLRRISNEISRDTYNKLLEAIDALLLIKTEECQQTGYVASRRNSNGKGRPAIQISEGQLALFYNEGFTATKMANHLGCSRSAIYKKLYELNMPMRARYSQISDTDLKTKIMQIHEEHPNAGYMMMQSYLKAAEIIVPRYRVRENLSAVDPIGTASRWSRSIKRRTYQVETPNSLWHMDAHLKLSRWGFVVHGCIDEYSRLIIYLTCETSIQAEPVVNFFIGAVNSYGLPSRVQSDHGYENLLVAILMNTVRGVHRESHITGKSVHNQRIERLWVDVFKEVCDSVYTELYSLENQGLLDVENIKHRFCVQYVYKPVINKKLLSFSSAWNVHSLRTENNKTPRQLWLEGILANYNTTYTAVSDIFDTNMSLHERLSDSLRALEVDLSVPIIDSNDMNFVPSSFTALLNLNDEQKLHLENIINTVEKSNIEKYVLCINLLSS
ncbi:uncharacterized protein [Temnothorax longispinosus]|uniref:uncharacterized protein n=1 Tax=Temnothorax longispinosus TaxID=300112 RepID=UPI003A9925BC